MSTYQGINTLCNKTEWFSIIRFQISIYLLICIQKNAQNACNRQKVRRFLLCSIGKIILYLNLISLIVFIFCICISCFCICNLYINQQSVCNSLLRNKNLFSKNQIRLSISLTFPFNTWNSIALLVIMLLLLRHKFEAFQEVCQGISYKYKAEIKER